MIYQGDTCREFVTLSQCCDIECLDHSMEYGVPRAFYQASLSTQYAMTTWLKGGSLCDLIRKKKA